MKVVVALNNPESDKVATSKGMYLFSLFEQTVDVENENDYETKPQTINHLYTLHLQSNQTYMKPLTHIVQPHRWKQKYI